MTTCVDYEARREVALVRLNRPDRLNAVVPDLVDGVLTAFERAVAERVRVVVVCGAGRSFCAGHDLKEPAATEDESQARARLQRIQDVTRAIRGFPGPVIAAVHGYALGAGAEFALGCDLVVASEDARFGFPEVSVGLSVTGGISALLPRAVGLVRAKELLMLGEHLSAVHARDLGLVNRVVPTGEHEAAAQEWAQAMVTAPPTALSLAKMLLDEGADSSVPQALDREVAAALATIGSGENLPVAEAFRRRP